VISGVYHLVNNTVQINKYDLLCKINEVYNLGKQIVRTQGPKSINKILVNTRNEIEFDIPNYDKMLNELKNYQVEKL
jgi:dTDP-4-dehydrorhamnose reductase